ncbi:MAG: hypothetical protein M3N52_01010 [Actinomycetota bacterium]|nr:hypothetical protein [Actinomycetota bacterium]
MARTQAVFPGRRGDTGARLLHNKTPIEQTLAGAGVGYTILRPVWFFQNLWAAQGYSQHATLNLPMAG